MWCCCCLFRQKASSFTVCRWLRCWWPGEPLGSSPDEVLQDEGSFHSVVHIHRTDSNHSSVHRIYIPKVFSTISLAWDNLKLKVLRQPYRWVPGKGRMRSRPSRKASSATKTNGCTWEQSILW